MIRIPNAMLRLLLALTLAMVMLALASECAWRMAG